MTKRGAELMHEFTSKYPKTEGAAENWWDNLSDEDKQEVIATIQDTVIAINQLWEVLRVAIMEAVKAFGEAFAEFSKVCYKYSEPVKKGFMTEKEADDILRHEYVTCSICLHRYIGKIPKGGDGSVLFPRQHYRTIPVITNLGIMPRNRKKVVCEGSYRVAKECQHE